MANNYMLIFDCIACAVTNEKHKHTNQNQARHYHSHCRCRSYFSLYKKVNMTGSLQRTPNTAAATTNRAACGPVEKC